MAAKMKLSAGEATGILLNITLVNFAAGTSRAPSGELNFGQKGYFRCAYPFSKLMATLDAGSLSVM